MNDGAGNDGDDKLVINKTDGQFIVEKGANRVKKALENGQTLVAVDVVKC